MREATKATWCWNTNPCRNADGSTATIDQRPAKSGGWLYHWTLTVPSRGTFSGCSHSEAQAQGRIRATHREVTR